jgi:ABC-2 type transport system ATP-binding protein
MRDSDYAIRISGLSKFYAKFQALDRISLSIKRGDFHAFLGPNGAGKTTTINIITGLSNYNAGDVRVFGYNVTSDYRDARRLIGLCTQEFNFDPFLSVYKLLSYQAGYFGIPSSNAKLRATELLQHFQLWEKRDAKYRALSDGMKKRLLLCRALIHDPEIIILDEPTAGCDLELKFLIWDHLSRLNKQGKTIFLTTHYMEEAERLCKTISIINHGRIVRNGAKENILADKSLQDVFLEVTGFE